MQQTRTLFMDVFEAAMNEAGHQIEWVDTRPGHERWTDPCRARWDDRFWRDSHRALLLACSVTGEWCPPTYEEWA